MLVGETKIDIFKRLLTKTKGIVTELGSWHIVKCGNSYHGMMAKIFYLNYG